MKETTEGETPGVAGIEAGVWDHTHRTPLGFILDKTWPAS